MTAKHYLATLFLSSCLVSPVLAQSTPPPPQNTAGASQPSLGEQLGQVLFSAAEKKLIEEFYGHSATTATQQTTSQPPTTTTASGRILKQVLDTVTGQPTGTTSITSESDQGQDGAEGGEGGEGGKSGKNKGGKKAKNKKNKGKGKNKTMPPGLAKRDALPPGLQKQLEKNGKLPPGLAKRDLPSDLTAKLPPEQSGTERVISGNNVVLVDQATGIILDILRDVVTGKN